ncbi:MAG: DUF455 family protein [Candidatus Dormibacteraceae bacterium]
MDNPGRGHSAEGAGGGAAARAEILGFGHDQARWMRLDVAGILTRYFFLEEALARSVSGWIPALRRIESKAALAKVVWQDVLAAEALRNRVFELRYPSRLMREGADASLIALFRAVVNAPSALGLLRAVQKVLNPALVAAYREYLSASDALADGPTYRFMRVVVDDKEEQCRTLESVLHDEPAPTADEQQAAERFVGAVGALLKRAGGLSLGRPETRVEVPAVVEPGRLFALAEDPGRDDAYRLCSYYWPDVVDPSYPYGEGVALQIRSAVSHLNEVWAVDTAAAILHGLAAELGWGFVADAGRWLYDESRHMTMGQRRLDRWGMARGDVPLGDYIYLASRDQDLIYRLGMLGYFETKNIGKKQVRAQAFQEMGDRTSQMDMDFDWADETLHAEYGRRWLRRLLAVRGGSEEDWPQVLERCEQLVADRVGQATDADRTAIREIAERLLDDARRAVGVAGSG